jgi:hypothetical protein
MLRIFYLVASGEMSHFASHHLQFLEGADVSYGEKNFSRIIEGSGHNVGKDFSPLFIIGSPD